MKTRQTKTPVSHFFQILWPIQDGTMSKSMARAFQICITHRGGDDFTLSYRPSKSTQISVLKKKQRWAVKKKTRPQFFNCRWFINMIETFFHIVYLVLYLIGLRNRSIKGFQFKTNLIQPASRLLQYFTSAWKIAFAFFLQTLPTDQDKDSQAGVFSWITWGLSDQDLYFEQNLWLL